MSSAYVPDDSHRLPDPSSRSASRTPGGGLKILMYLVFVLALAATIIMFFVDSEVWLTVAVITSLWAAFFGAILVSRYSGILSEETSVVRASWSVTTTRGWPPSVTRPSRRSARSSRSCGSSSPISPVRRGPMSRCH